MSVTDVTSQADTQAHARSALREAGLSTASAADYINLLKPRVMSLVVLTALVGLVAAPVALHPLVSFTAIVCIAVGAGASGALNMWYDADIDRVMGRTATRPIPSGAVRPRDALTFGLLLSAFSVVILGLLVNWQSAAALAFTIFFYAVIYTMWLKRSTPQNIVIGGAAGAFPPAIGWLAATGTLSLEPVLMVAIIFMWTPAHFWALALLKSADYGRAGVPMMPNVMGDQHTRKQIVLYSVLLAPLGAAPAFLGFAGAAYALVAVAGGAAFVWFSIRLLRATDIPTRNKAAGQLFGFSITYLFALFLVMLGEDLIIDVFGLAWRLPEALIWSVGI
ncbi:MAG: heme o synthase [Devosiaceae bacterium]|nr:heme o synthase [Devosiaceae bacterium MH13]